MEAEAVQQFFGGGVGRRPSSPTPVCSTDTYCRTELWIDFFCWRGAMRGHTTQLPAT
jgi:hypothetical protein